MTAASLFCVLPETEAADRTSGNDRRVSGGGPRRGGVFSELSHEEGLVVSLQQEEPLLAT